MKSYIRDTTILKEFVNRKFHSCHTSIESSPYILITSSFSDGTSKVVASPHSPYSHSSRSLRDGVDSRLLHQGDTGKVRADHYWKGVGPLVSGWVWTRDFRRTVLDRVRGDTRVWGSTTRGRLGWPWHLSTDSERPLRTVEVRLVNSLAETIDHPTW